jgi:DNA-binding NtrC family response regulator
MNEGLARSPSLHRFPRLLIAADYASTVEPLLRTFRDDRLDVEFDLCTSQTSATNKLSARPYHLIIAGAHLAEVDDFFLLKRSQSLPRFVPFLVTASPSEKDSAARVLAQGAFDLIPTPVDHEQTVTAIRLALWNGKLRSLIQSKERMVDKCLQHLADYPGERLQVQAWLGDALSAFEKAIAAVDQSLLRIGESAARLSEVAIKVEQDARARAFARLDRLGS